jgi:predicted ATP-grasp superfamily ATP-dependent carboligase
VIDADVRLVSFPPSPRPTGPLVLVLELESHMALTFVRGLGREGVACLGVSYEGVTFGCRSKYLRGYAALTPRNGEELIARTLELIRLARPDFVMAATETVMTLLNSCRDLLPRGTKLLFAEQAVLDRAFDKSASLRTAEALGIPVPGSYSAAKILESGELPRDASFPLVLKPPVPYRESPWREIDFRYGFCSTTAEVVETLRRFEKAPYLPLVQEYCDGRGVGVELCMHRGEVIDAFQHERLRENPPSGGVSVMRRSAPLDPVLFDESARLLRALGWEGLAMVEYRCDDRSGRHWMMEVNGRLWGSICLPLRCGVNFPLLLLQSLGFDLRTGAELGDYPANVYCRALSLDLRRLMTVLRQGRDCGDPPRSRWKALGEFLRDFLRRSYYDIEWAEDPRPAVYYWRERFSGATRKLAAGAEATVPQRGRFVAPRRDPWIASLDQSRFSRVDSESRETRVVSSA